MEIVVHGLYSKGIGHTFLHRVRDEAPMHETSLYVSVSSCTDVFPIQV